MGFKVKTTILITAMEHKPIAMNKDWESDQPIECSCENYVPYTKEAFMDHVASMIFDALDKKEEENADNHS